MGSCKVRRRRREIASPRPTTTKGTAPAASFTSTGELLRWENDRSQRKRSRTGHLPVRDLPRLERRCGALELVIRKLKIPAAFAWQGFRWLA